MFFLVECSGPVGIYSCGPKLLTSTIIYLMKKKENEKKKRKAYLNKISKKNPYLILKKIKNYFI